MGLILYFKKDGSFNMLMLGLIILRLDLVILKGRTVLNIDLIGLDHVILKGRIVQDVDVGIDHP